MKIFRFFAFVFSLFLPQCKGYDRQEIIRQHDLLVEDAKNLIPEMEELEKNEKVIFVIEGFPKLEARQKIKCYFLKDERYVCILTFFVEVEKGKIKKFVEREMKIKELDRVFLTDSDSVHKRYKNSWTIKDEEKLTVLARAQWDLSKVGIPKKSAVKDSHLIYKSWDFLYR